MPSSALHTCSSSRGYKPPQSHRTAKTPPLQGNSRHGLPPQPALGVGGAHSPKHPQPCPSVSPSESGRAHPWTLSPLGPCFLVTVGATHPQERSPLSAKHVTNSFLPSLNGLCFSSFFSYKTSEIPTGRVKPLHFPLHGFWVRVLHQQAFI